MSQKFRNEHDSMGTLKVPAEALWGAQTQRAVDNFPISGRPMPRGFIRALGLVKAAAADVNANLGWLPKRMSRAIHAAALQVARGDHDAQFPIDIYQTGSGTSSNMNANEVIATLASRGAGAVDTLPIVRADAADAAELFTLQLACWVREALDNDTLDIPALHETPDDARARMRDWTVCIVRRKGRLVAAVAGRLQGSTWEIGRLMVAPDQGGRGLGRRLLDHIQAIAPASAVSFALHTGANSLRNQRMYARAGFRLRDDLPTPVGTVVMTKARLPGAGTARPRVAVHPNDHVNLGQSSNDVIPTAIRVAAQLAVVEDLQPALAHLRKAIDRRAKASGRTVKTGRTHLMDAMPLTFAQEFGAWSAQLASAQARIDDALKRLRRLPIGGTAIGTGINADPRFGKAMAKALGDLTKTRFVSADDKFEGLASQDDAVELSGQLNALAVALMKIANDLRWMNSGPLAGLGEIELQALQPGSSIMPGKVNPVIPEATVMVCAQVMGHHAAISVAGQTGNFQLNVTLPLIAANLLDSIGLLANVARLLADKAIATLVIREDNVVAALDRNPILVTALNPIIGYEKAAAIAKRAYKEMRPVMDVAREDSGLSEQELKKALDPVALTKGGIHSKKTG